jgi:hypothetical protein
MTVVFGHYLRFESINCVRWINPNGGLNTDLVRRPGIKFYDGL